MKIGIVRAFLSNKIGGAEISANLLTENLEKKKEDVFIVCARKDFASKQRFYELLPKAPSQLLMFGSFITDFLLYRKMRKVFLAEKPDVIHIQDFSIMPSAVKAAKSLDIPIVMTVRDYRFVCNLAVCLSEGRVDIGCGRKKYFSCLKQTFNQRYGHASLAYLFYPFLYSRNKKLINSTPLVDEFITVSDFVKDEMTKRGFSKNRIKTIYVPAPNWKPSPHKNEDKDQTIRIFSQGLLAESKGFHILIDAMRIAVKKNKKLNLVIAGSGPLENKLKKMVEEYNLSKNITFLGRVTFNQIKEEYEKASFVVIPSIWPEPLGRSILESFSLKKPIVSTNAGGIKELVIDGKTGLNVNINDAEAMGKAILKMAESKKLRENYAKNGYALIKKIDARFLKDHLDIYASFKR